MNLMINSTCNRSCPYCFARSKVTLPGNQVAAPAPDMTLENFEKYLDFHVASQLTRVKLLGGEPTLHPEFIEFLERAHARGLPSLVLTNGLWPAKVQAALRSIPMADWGLKFLFNVNEPHLQPAGELARARENMALAGRQGNLGFNIYSADFDLQFVADLIDDCGLDRTVRLGLASPIVGRDNAFVEEASFTAIGQRLIEELRQLERRDVLGWFDCGFPLCMFPEAMLGSLMVTTRGFESICDYPIDVGPELTAWPCFPLADYKTVAIADFRTVAEIQDYFYDRLAEVRRTGSTAACPTCKYLRRGQCCGGCSARALKARQPDQAGASPTAP
jgi:sulfatase maturation enzyme AslB (radical SAM superfamily)